MFLSDTEGTPMPTWAAYGSTHPDAWGHNATHYCCSEVGLGCPPIATQSQAAYAAMLEAGQ